MTPAVALTALLGAALAAVILWDAFETILVPRRIGRRIRLTRWFYMIAWRLWRAWALRIGRPGRREAFLGFFGPLSLVVLIACWAGGLIVAFALLQWAVAAGHAETARSFRMLLYLSGETFFTLGLGDVAPPPGLARLLCVTEAGLGFGFLGTVIGYLPTMYAAFAQREMEISLLDARAGSPPTAAEILGRLPAEGAGAACDAQLRGWERWAAQVLETHISYPQLAYYRSQHLNQSWLAALTAILDSSALVVAGVDGLPSRQARLTFAMARHALVDITQIFLGRAPAGECRRLTPEAMGALRERLAGGPAPLSAAADYDERLAALRLRYEPYARALAAHLLFELPPWIHAARRRDNWEGGPWDRMLEADIAHTPSATPAHRSEEHF